jgi:hypothetical protein
MEYSISLQYRQNSDKSAIFTISPSRHVVSTNDPKEILKLQNRD